jgi:hypothetical protein
LGDAEDVDSKLYNLLNNADGAGSSYYSVPKKASLGLTIKHTVFGLVDGVTRNEDDEAISGATIKMINPEAVINKIYENGRLIACRVEELRDERNSLDDEVNIQTCYTDYTLDGWRRFKMSGGDTNIEQEIGSGEYAYFATAERKERILPIFEVSLNLDRPIGYIWAKKCIAIANAESQLDHAHRNVSFQLLRIVASGGDNGQYADIVGSLKNGTNSIRQEPEARHVHDFFGPSSDFFKASDDRIKERISNFFHGMFKDYGDAAKERTATEIRLESQSGIEAFLTLLAESVDEFENKALWRYMQAELPDEPQYWGDAYVRRPSDFSPVDVDAIAEKLSDRYITGLSTVPTDAETMVNILSEIFKSDGIPAPEESELRTIAESYLNSQSQERDLSGAMGV